jgi:hypothetical protein
MDARFIIFIAVYSIFIPGAMIWVFSQVVGLIRAKGVPFVPLTSKKLQEVFNHVKLKPTDSLVDLGSGDGRVLRSFEKQGVTKLAGYEVNYWAYLQSLVKNKFYHSKAKMYFKNFKKVDLGQYNIVFCYLLEGYLTSLKDKFDKELKPGTKVISYGFQVKDWLVPEIIYTIPENKNLGLIFIYTIK